jgi:hypothetical protein
MNQITLNYQVSNSRGTIAIIKEKEIGFGLTEYSYQAYIVNSDGSTTEISNKEINQEMSERRQFLLGINLKYIEEITGDDWITFNVETIIGDEFPFGLHGLITIGYNIKWKQYYIMQTKTKGIFINILYCYNILSILNRETNAKIIEQKKLILNTITDDERQLLIEQNDYNTLQEIELNNKLFVYEFDIIKTF